MQPLTAADPESRSADILAQNIEQLTALFPEVVVEGKIDFVVLKQLLGGSLEEREEKYGLNWHGKRQARQLALTPSTGTLRPYPEESVDWETTQNLMIEGDNLEVLKLLQKSYAGKVKLIYIDPPYNTGRDLIYPNDFQDGIRTYLEVTGQIAGGAKLTSNTDASGRFHTNWINLMYPRLRLARNLLRKDGVLICTIDENEQANLGVLLKDVFDEGNYEHVCVTVVHNPRGIQGTNFSYTHEYAFFVYPRGTKSIGDRKIDEDEISWSQFRNWGTESERTDAKNCFYPVIVQDGEIVGFGDVCPDDYHPDQTEYEGATALVYPIDRGGTERKWRYARQSVESIAHLLRARPTGNGYEIEIGKDFGLYRTVWTDKRYDANEYGTKILNALVPNSPFSFPKSLWTVYDSLYAVVGNEQDAIILDFFAGSGTTGHAVYEMNKEDGGNRRYILVQLPELIENNGIYNTIADVTKERVRQAGKAIAREAAESAKKTPQDDLFASSRLRVSQPLDTGFRVFKLDSSNLHTWEADRQNLEQMLLEQANHIKPGRSEEDILYELLLKLGLDLCVPIEEREVSREAAENAKEEGGEKPLAASRLRVSAIGGGVLMACLSPEIGRGDVEALGQGIVAWHKELNPAGDTTCVFRDSAFVDDVAKTNLAAILQQHGIQNVRSL